MMVVGNCQHRRLLVRSILPSPSWFTPPVPAPASLVWKSPFAQPTRRPGERKWATPAPHRSRAKCSLFLMASRTIAVWLLEVKVDPRSSIGGRGPQADCVWDAVYPVCTPLTCGKRIETRLDPYGIKHRRNRQLVVSFIHGCCRVQPRTFAIRRRLIVVEIDCKTRSSYAVIDIDIPRECPCTCE